MKDAWPEENTSPNKVASQAESRSRHSSTTSRNEEPPSSPSLFLRPLSSSRSPPPSTPRQSSEPPHSAAPHPVSTNSSTPLLNRFQLKLRQDKFENSQDTPFPRSVGRDNRSMERPVHFDGGPESMDYIPNPRSEGRPPSGRRGRPSLPLNFQSLPPRLKKKYEEDLIQSMLSMGGQVSPLPASSLSSLPATANRSVAEDWDGSSLTFTGASGPSPRPSMPPPAFIPPSFNYGGRSSRSGRTGGSRSEHEDVDSLLVRPGSQDSLSGLNTPADHASRDRKTSFTDSRSSTPSSVDYNSSQFIQKGMFKKLISFFSKFTKNK